MTNSINQFETVAAAQEYYNARMQEGGSNAAFAAVIRELHEISEKFILQYEALNHIPYLAQGNAEDLNVILGKIRTLAENIKTNAQNLKEKAKTLSEGLDTTLKVYQFQAERFNKAPQSQKTVENLLTAASTIRNIEDRAANALVEWRSRLEKCIRDKEFFLKEYDDYQISQKCDANKGANFDNAPEDVEGAFQDVANSSNALGEEVQQLRAYVAELKARDRERQEAQQQVQLLQAQIKDAHDQCQQLTGQVNALREQLQDEQRQRKSIEQQLKNVQEQPANIANMQKELEGAQWELQQFRRTNAELREKLELATTQKKLDAQQENVSPVLQIPKQAAQEQQGQASGLPQQYSPNASPPRSPSFFKQASASFNGVDKATLILSLSRLAQSYEDHLNGCFSFWYKERKTHKNRVINILLTDVKIGKLYSDKEIDDLIKQYPLATAGRSSEAAKLIEQVRQYNKEMSRLASRSDSDFSELSVTQIPVK
jgi:chromosome segregation ATPase